MTPEEAVLFLYNHTREDNSLEEARELQMVRGFLLKEIGELRSQVTHWKNNHADAVKRKKKGQEITSAIISELRDDLEKAHERIGDLEEQLGEGDEHRSVETA